MFVATYHGRGDAPEEWQEHGVDQKASEKIWIAIIGSEPAPGEVGRALMVGKPQIASIVAALLGKNYMHDAQEAAAPIRDDLSETSASH